METDTFDKVNMKFMFGIFFPIDFLIFVNSIWLFYENQIMKECYNK